jgi:hypothetical protein
MDDVTPLRHADVVLLVLKKDRGHINFDDLTNRVKPNGIDGDIVLRILEKLKRDNHVYEKQRHTGGVDYAITVEGSMFIGYEKQRIIDEEKIRISQNTASQAKTYANRLLLVTGIAGAAALLLFLWQIFVWINPSYANFPYVLFGAIRK